MVHTAATERLNSSSARPAAREPRSARWRSPLRSPVPADNEQSAHSDGTRRHLHSVATGSALIHEHKSTHRRIEWLRRCEAVDFTFLEPQTFESARSHSRTVSRRTEHARIAVHADDATRRTHELRRQEADVAGAAADIQHPHPGRNAGLAEDAVRLTAARKSTV